MGQTIRLEPPGREGNICAKQNKNILLGNCIQYLMATKSILICKCFAIDEKTLNKN